MSDTTSMKDLRVWAIERIYGPLFLYFTRYFDNSIHGYFPAAKSALADATSAASIPAEPVQ